MVSEFEKIESFSIYESLLTFLETHQEYFKILKKEITQNNTAYPYIKIKLGDVMGSDEKLLNHLLKKPEKAIDQISTKLFEQAKNDNDVKEFLKDPRCMYRGMHISLDIEDFTSLIPLYEHFTSSTRRFKGILIRIRGLFSSLILQKEIVARSIEFTCYSDHTFEVLQEKGIKGKYRYPSFCVHKKCKARAKRDFVITKKIDEFERGYFQIHERDLTQKQVDCYTFLNYDYFNEIISHLNINDEVEILGIIQNDFSELESSSRDNQKINEYIEVIDIQPLRLRKTNPKLIEDLHDKFNKDRNFHHKILDSIHPFSREIYHYRILKLIIAMGIGTADSWDTTIKARNSTNSISGSRGGQLKSSIARAFQKYLGINSLGIISGMDTTKVGLIPTSQRGNRDSDNLIFRYGALAFYNRWLLIIEESQYMIKKPEVFHQTKYLEDGIIDRAMDGEVINAEVKLAMLLLMNYDLIGDGDEEYDYNRTLKENLKNIQSSELQRFDLHYPIPPLPEIFIELLETRMFETNHNVYSEEFIFNYFMEYRRIVKEGIKLSPELQDSLKSYIHVLRMLRETSKSRTIREFRILVKLVIAIAGMRLKNIADLDDLAYINEYLLNYMIPFFDSDKIRFKRNIDITKIFRNIFKLLTEIRNIIPLSLVISLVQDHLKSFHFPRLKCAGNNGHRTHGKDKDTQLFYENRLPIHEIEKKYHEHIGDELNTSNAKFRKEFEDKENKEYIKNLGYIIGKITNSVHFINKNWLLKTISSKSIDILNKNNNTLELEELINLISKEFALDRDTMKFIINELVKEKTLSNKNGVISSKVKPKQQNNGEIFKKDLHKLELDKSFVSGSKTKNETARIDYDRIFIDQAKSTLNKLDILMNRLKEISEENNNNSLEKSNVIQVLEVEEELDRQFIENALEELLEDGTLSEPKKNLIKFTVSE